MSHPVFAPGLIILEGADGVGKSTLGRFLANHFGGFYFHATATKTLIPAMQDYQTNLIENVEENVLLGRTIIMDRFWPSELVYGSVFRPDNSNGFDAASIASRCDVLSAIYVLCFSDTAIERHKVKKDPMHPYADRDFDRVYSMYEAFWEDHKHRRDCIRYHLETDGARLRDFALLIHTRFNEIRKA